MVVRLFLAFNAHWEKILKHVSEIRQRQVLKKRGKKNRNITEKRLLLLKRWPLQHHSSRSVSFTIQITELPRSSSCRDEEGAHWARETGGWDILSEPMLEAAVRKVSQASAGPAFTNGYSGARISRSRAGQSMWPCGPREASQTDPLGLYPWVRLTTDPGKPALRIICTCWGNRIKNKIFSYTRKPLHKVVETENRCVSE